MTDHFHAAADGTRLYARVEGQVDSGLTPLLCLPGLTRNSRDFEPVIARYAQSRQVITMDFRGRGNSAFADDAKTYRPDVELQDTLGFLDALGVAKTAVLGTSRGGIVGMLMAALAPDRLSGLCLNDVGCKLETEGLLRIIGYVSQPVQFANWDEAARRIAERSVGFSGVSHQQWINVVQRFFITRDGRVEQNHDLRLGETMPSIYDVRDGKLAELWTLLPALANLPVALLRGAGSDLLSNDTVLRMQHVAPHLQHTVIPGRGHVPFLDERESVDAIDAWLKDVDAKEKGQ